MSRGKALDTYEALDVTYLRKYRKSLIKLVFTFLKNGTKILFKNVHTQYSGHTYQS